MGIIKQANVDYNKMSPFGRGGAKLSNSMRCGLSVNKVDFLYLFFAEKQWD